MRQAPAALTPAPAPWLTSFERFLRAQNRSAQTIRSYRAALRRLSIYLDATGMPTEPTVIARDHLESFQSGLLGELQA